MHKINSKEATQILQVCGLSVHGLAVRLWPVVIGTLIGQKPVVARLIHSNATNLWKLFFANRISS